MNRTPFILYIYKIIFVLILTGLTTLKAQDLLPVSDSDSLKETGAEQRRDLSLPGSRLVINYFDFNSKFTASEYSNRSSLPLNVAYLSTGKNKPGDDKASRMSRAVKDLLTVYYQNKNSRTLVAADIFDTEWTPYSLPFTAKYPDGAELKGADFFFNEQVLVRQLSVKKWKGNVVLKGAFEGKGRITNNRVIISNNHINYVISINKRDAQYNIINNVWTIIIPVNGILNDLVALISFGDSVAAADSMHEVVKKKIKNKNTDLLISKQKQHWDDFLTRLPHPTDFQLKTVNSKGVKPTDIQKAYYKAWIFTAQNLLPEDPEIYPYPQFCTGKPSLWDEGEPRAPFSAAWESFLGIQFYTYIDPVIAWKAFKGLMSLVDEEGMLGGESLPSRKAQTAILLYNVTGDLESLRSVYPALSRYLNWRMKITHWVYRELRPSKDNKDAEFAFSALIDMQHMATIAEHLDLAKEADEWRSKHAAFLNKCLDWFWEAPALPPYEGYDLQTGKRSLGHTIWVTTGLYVNPGLKGDYLKSMMERFEKEFDPEKNFAGFVMPKYPDLAYTINGLINHGYIDKATMLLEANIRDIVRSNASFAEQYIGENLQPDGVRPSLFGSSAIIDFCMLLNGFKFDKGLPEMVRLKNASGAVNNILHRNKKINIDLKSVQETP